MSGWQQAISTFVGLIIFLLCVASGTTGYDFNPEHNIFQPTTSEERNTERLVLFVSLTIIVVIITSFIHSSVLPDIIKTFVPESALICFIGILIGLIVKDVDDKDNKLRELVTFDEEVFFSLLLPPIIFYAGYSLHKEHGSYFFKNIGTILTFAVIGTLVSTLFIAISSYIISTSNIVNLSMVECWLFGTLISAIDPVATIAIFEQFKIDNALFNLIFGESILNDATVIVLFRTVNRFAEKDLDFDAETFFYAIFEFLYISVGSISIGIAFGFAFSLITKHLKLHGDLPTLSLIMFAYLSYVIAEVATLSGIICILTFGISTSHYAWYNLAEEHQLISYKVSRMMGRTSEAFVFAYIGISVFALKDHDVNVGFIVLALLFCLLGRVLNIGPLSALINKRWPEQIPFLTQLVMCFSGLRGAIAFGLALDVKTEHAHVIKTTTLAIVIISIFVNGGLTLPLLTALDIVKKKGESMEESIEKKEGEPQSLQTKLYFLKWDKKYLTPFLCKPGIQRSLTQLSSEDEAGRTSLQEQDFERGREQQQVQLPASSQIIQQEHSDAVGKL